MMHAKLDYASRLSLTFNQFHVISPCIYRPTFKNCLPLIYWQSRYQYSHMTEQISCHVKNEDWLKVFFLKGRTAEMVQGHLASKGAMQDSVVL